MRFSVFFVVFSIHSQEKMTKWCCVFCVFFRVYMPNMVIGIVLMAHQLLTPPLCQTLEVYSGLPPPS